MAKTKAATPPAKKAGAKKSAAQDADIARKIWLAGVGAYNETQDAAGKLAKSANESFHQLVARGEEVEEAVRAQIIGSAKGDKLAALMGAWTARAQKLTEEQAALIGANLVKVRQSVADTLAPWNVAALGAAVEKLAAEVESLSKEVKTLKGGSRAARPAAASKPATARKAPARKG